MTSDVWCLLLFELTNQLYSNDCVSNYGLCSIIKFADDTVVFGKISRNNSVHYLVQVNDLLHVVNRTT